MTSIPCTTPQTTWVGIDIAKKHNDLLVDRPGHRRRFRVANQLDLRRSKFPDDLLCRVTLPAHLPAPLLDPKRNPKIHPGSISGGRIGVKISDPSKTDSR
jgi:hypothetical protein